MALAITIQGIDEALSHFNYKNKPALKYRFISLIRGYYEDETAIETVAGIDTDALVKALWDTGNDLTAVKNRRKNLKSVKSAINNELNKLYEAGKNPEGITIGPANTFVMSDEARNSAFEAFIKEPKEDGAALVEQVKDVLKILNEVLANSPYFDDAEEKDDPGRLEEIKALIRDLTDTAGLSGAEFIRADAGISHMKPVEEAEAEELAPDEEMEEVDGDEVEELLEEVEEAEEIDPDEELEEVEEVEEAGLDEDLEEVDGDEVDELLEEVDEAEEIDPDEDLEEVDGDEVDELLEEVDEAEEIDPDEEVEEVDGDEVDEAEAGDETGPAEGVSDDIHPDESGGTIDEEKRAQLLAEKFNESLAAMDKFYNQYILIPEDNYTIGSGISGKSRNIERVVHLSPFYMGKFPVTNVLFEIFVEETGYKTTAETVGYGTVFHGRHFGKKTNERDTVMAFSCNSALSVKVVKGACWYQPFGPGSTLYGKRSHPVVQVSLEDAMAFAAWTGKRLPTEEEWEAASRTSSGHPFPWGDEWIDNTCNIEESLVGDTTPVDKYGAFENRYGIADTLGNVLEWTVTRSKEPDQEESGSGLYVAKGGSFISGNGIRLSDRIVLQSQYHSNILGFRSVAY